MQLPTPITDRLEAEIEAGEKRDVPVRVYHLMRKLESERAQMLAALQKAIEWADDNGKKFRLSVESDSGVANAIKAAVALGNE